MKDHSVNNKKIWQEPSLKPFDISGGLDPGTGETFINGIPLGGS
jgi:hypothetical protein